MLITNDYIDFNNLLKSINKFTSICIQFTLLHTFQISVRDISLNSFKLLINLKPVMQLSGVRTQSDRKSFQDTAQHKDIDSRWVQLKFDKNFAPRSYFASCIQAGNIYIHGGFSAQAGIMKDFLVTCLHQSPSSWRTINAKNLKICNPGPLRNHTLNSYYSQLILVGGQKNVIENNNQIYRYDLLSNIWSICKCLDAKGKPFNYALDSHSAIVHSNFMYIMGGYDSVSTEYLNIVVKIDLSKASEDLLTFQIIKDDHGPYKRANSSCCLVQNKIYLFGGGNMEDAFDDLWIFNIETSRWENTERIPENITWPDKRKGATLVWHKQSNNLFLFGGIRKITKQQNDINVYMLQKKRWIKIHSTTNDLYDPSPTVKQQIQSPSIYESKKKKQHSHLKTQQVGGFNLSMKPVSHYQRYNQFCQTNVEFMKKEASKKQGIQTTNGEFKRRMSVVQEKKYRQFLNRKKRLLGNIESGYDTTKPKRSHSPTSEALAFSLSSMGEQSRNQRSEINLPKVIYDQEKGQVIGKKPCARDGHAGLVYEDAMIILGGDRHMVSFNDVYEFRMNKGVESLPHYG